MLILVWAAALAFGPVLGLVGVAAVRGADAAGLVPHAFGASPPVALAGGASSDDFRTALGGMVLAKQQRAAVSQDSTRIWENEWLP